MRRSFALFVLLTLAGTTRADGLTESARRKLLADAGLEGRNVGVRLEAGRLSLFGVLPDAATRERLTAAARKLPGVTEVSNECEVAPPRDDLAERVRSAVYAASQAPPTPVKPAARARPASTPPRRPTGPRFERPVPAKLPRWDAPVRLGLPD